MPITASTCAGTGSPQTYGPDGPGPRIPVHGPAGTARRMAQAYGLDEHPGMTEAFDFGTLEPGTREIGPFRVTLAHVNHPVETFGFRIEAGRPDPGLLGGHRRVGRAGGPGPGADLLLCEASFLNGPDLPEGLHLTARQAADTRPRPAPGADPDPSGALERPGQDAGGGGPALPRAAVPGHVWAGGGSGLSQAGVASA